MEIERKFLVSACPDLTSYTCHFIEQSYISMDPVIRLRQKDDYYFLTVKSKGHMIREEFEIELTSGQYHTLLPKVEGHKITKKRYIIPIYNNLIAELDLYSNNLDGLITVEVEFATESDALTFIPPHWFGKDVTEDVRYKNNYMALHGIPV